VVIVIRGQGSALSAARAIADHLHDWLVGTPPGEFVSMAVYSDGSYGIAKDIVFSFPVTCKGGSWTIVPNIPWSEATKLLIRKTEAELLEEKGLLPEGNVASAPAAAASK